MAKVDRFIYTFSLILGMTTVRAWVVMNVALSFVAVVLLFYLLGIHLPSVGQAISLFDKNKPLCFVEWKNDFTSWTDLDQCCLEARKQLSCESEDQTIDSQRMTRVCATGKNSVRIHLNTKAYSACQRIPIW